MKKDWKEAMSKLRLDRILYVGLVAIILILLIVVVAVRGCGGEKETETTEETTTAEILTIDLGEEGEEINVYFLSSQPFTLMLKTDGGKETKVTQENNGKDFKAKEKVEITVTEGSPNISINSQNDNIYLFSKGDWLKTDERPYETSFMVKDVNEWMRKEAGVE